MDADGYPTEEELRKVREWPYDDLVGLFDFLRSLWRYPNYFRVNKRAHCPMRGHIWRYRISTGGWSGHEELMRALSENRMAWALTWESKRSGGHYVFEVPRPPKSGVKKGR